MEAHQNAAVVEFLAEMRDRSSFWLSGNDLADCGSPDSVGSAGADLLVSVRDQVCDLIEGESESFASPDEFYQMDGDGSLHEITDGAPSIYTHTKWAEFLDLCAYNEDPTELGCDGSDMSEAASICLYIIADRLANAIIDQAREAAENAEEPDED